ncbi:dynamin family protein [Bacillus salitolerans]|uniref:Dynamin family protein n=1 Tax=Bacillus salitolerans TaxID=1437434 RepID=A0ABW4LUB3_9BACI
MTQLTTGRPSLSHDELMTNLTGLYEEMKKSDQDRARKMVQLLKKVHDREYSIGFCGHFSAGKSSMINELAGNEILPSSPIPTSANLVKVRSGEEIARVYLFNGEVLEFPAPYDLNEIKKFCMDGDEVEWIEISTASSYIPDGVTILDTPGIDSVDDAHRVATESALHLADIILYMMDYNHVQSEVSFHFTKKLQEMNKPIYLVINQIDKHQDSELPFNEFQQGVIRSFSDWGVHPEGIFYTSLKDETSPNNQLSDLKSLLSLKWENRDEALLEGVQHSASTLIMEHIQRHAEERTTDSEKWLEKIAHLTKEQIDELSKTVSSLQKHIVEKRATVEEAKIWFNKELTKLLESAYVMPFQTRELAKLFLESIQPEFKVGFIFSKQKTETERQDRLQAFYEDLMEKVESQINWHVKDLLSTFLSNYDLEGTFSTELHDLKVEMTKADLHNLVKTGAKVTGDTVLHFTNDVANECKKRYKHEAHKILDTWLDFLQKKVEAELHESEQELKKYDEYVDAVHYLNNVRSELTSLENRLKTILMEGPMSDVQEVKQSLLHAFNEKKATQVVGKYEVKKEKPKAPIALEDKQNSSTLTRNVDPMKMVEKIEVVTSSLRGLKGTQTIVQQLTDKANRLKHQSFTIALFGAFSAGKSSFANALMGTKLLPVSPNPTTATINKIKPVTDEIPHGTVKVQVKDQEQLEKDLQFSLKFFDLAFHSMPEALKLIEKVLHLTDIEPRQKPHYSFLKAVHNGYHQMKDHLGQLLFVGLEKFEEFVANEEKSCFVEWIDVHYDCPLTKQGITLVDTPGADSINARHTGVAFEYIKNADAILFVTYYNHAFSKADREFLIQLGRVKDAFELDKMFFMINAADLAASEDELFLVTDYVTDQLMSYGIRNPRIYPLSSQLALKEKEGEPIHHSVLKSSGIAQFETEFKDFIKYELTELTVASARLDLKRVEHIISEYIETALIGNEQKEQRKEKLEQDFSHILELIQSMSTQSYERALEKETKELVYYVKQRIFLRFTDMFTESFHPSVLSDESKNIKKALSQCLEELLEFVAFDLAQELRATSVRLEGFINKQLTSIHHYTNEEILKYHESLQLSFVEGEKIKTLDIRSALPNINRDPINKVLSSFKNPKSFFEKNGKKQMRDDLESALQKPVTDYLEERSLEMAQFYKEEFLNKVKNWRNHGEIEVQHYFEGLFDILSEKMDIEELRGIQSKVSRLIQ